VFLGQFIFSALAITVADFQIAGGLILSHSRRAIWMSARTRSIYSADELGVVPLGLPLIAGPAMLATLLALVESLGMMITLAALIVNLVLVGVALRSSDQLARGVGLSRNARTIAAVALPARGDRRAHDPARVAGGLIICRCAAARAVVQRASAPAR